LPANFSLVGALNPCPCGYYGQQKQICHCSPQSIERYQGRFSGPLADRMDLFVNVPPVDLSLMNQHNCGESSASMREKVILARKWQRDRYGRVMTNGKMTRKDIRELSMLTAGAQKFLITCSEKLNLSARNFDRVIRVSRTIADLERSDSIYEEHIGEALQYRPMSNFMKH
jgi:magnesium chelatase family protein